MEEIEIRQAFTDDLDAAAEIESACFPKEQAASRESLKQRIKMFMVAQLCGSGKVVGFINGTVSNDRVISDAMYETTTYNPRGDYQMIFGLDVLPEYQKQGIARLLMEAMIRLAWEEGRRGLVLTCREQLVEFFEQFGYVNEGVSDSVHGGVVWYDMRLDF